MKADHRGIGLTSQRARDRLTQELREMGIGSREVLHAMRTVPRHLFVDEALAGRAYENTALPIGHSQTISQPYIVARMTEALFVSGAMDKVLEIGAGTGYQSAVLAQFAKSVHSIERIGALAARLRERLAALHYRTVRVKHGDGRIGWLDHAPYDAILIAAAVDSVPPTLLEQLAIGGRIVAPVGESGSQWLVLVTRYPEHFEEKPLEEVRFVPLIAGLG